MRIHALLTILIVTLAICATSSRFANAELYEAMNEHDTEQAVLKVFNSGRALSQIDHAFTAGQLTWDEAKALYSEQAFIRQAYIQSKTRHGLRVAARRAAFMLRMSQGSYARLTFNTTHRLRATQQVTWLW